MTFNIITKDANTLWAIIENGKTIITAETEKRTSLNHVYGMRFAISRRNTLLCLWSLKDSNPDTLILTLVGALSYSKESFMVLFDSIIKGEPHCFSCESIKNVKQLRMSDINGTNSYPWSLNAELALMLEFRNCPKQFLIFNENLKISLQ